MVLPVLANLSKMCADRMIVAIGSWCKVEVAFERLGQVALMRETAF